MEASLPHIPDMSLTEHMFILSTMDLEPRHAHAREELMKAIREKKMGPLYLFLHNHNVLSSQIPWDLDLYNEIKANNDATLESLDAEIAEAETLNGEHDITKALKKKAEYLASIGDKDKGVSAYKEIYERGGTTGVKIDIIFGIIRLAFFYSDWLLASSNLETAKTLIDEGGDWERRNRLRTYLGLYLLYCRKFSEAADLLLDSISTFSSSELITYSSVVKYAVIAGALSLPRVELKKRVIDSSEVLAILPCDPEFQSLEECVNSLYLCDYSRFFRALALVEQKHFKPDRYLAPHTRYYMREMRRKGYMQLLESYKVLSMESMAQTFGVKQEFIDADLSKFISEKKMFCAIDHVYRTIEMNRPDDKDRQYQDVVRQGDVLLNKLQKYQTAIVALK